MLTGTWLDFVKGWIGQIDVWSVHFFFAQADTLAEVINLRGSHESFAAQGFCRHFRIK